MADYLITIPIDFEKTETVGSFKDAILMTPEEFATYSEEEIEGMKQERYDNWVAIVTAPQEPVEQPVPYDPIPDIVDALTKVGADMAAGTVMSKFRDAGTNLKNTANGIKNELT